MAFPYLPALANYTPSFPTAVYTPHDFRNYVANGIETDDSFTVPAAVAGKVRYSLTYGKLLDVPGTTITVNSSARTIIPYGEAPSAGEVALDLKTGTVEFHSSDIGGTAAVHYTGRGTAITAYLLNQMGAELKATQGNVFTSLSSTTDNVVPRFDGTTGKRLQSSTVVVNDSGDASGIRNLAITGTFTATGLTSITPSTFIAKNGSNVVGYLDASAMRTALSLVPGTDVQAYSANLTDLAAITPVEEYIIMGTDADGWASKSPVEALQTLAYFADSSGEAMLFGGDAGLYRSAANILTMPAGDTFEAPTIRATDSKWISLSPAAQEASGFAYDFTNNYWQTTTTVKRMWYPINFAPGTKLTQFRIKHSQSGTNALTGWKLSYRDDSGTGTTVTTQGSVTINLTKDTITVSTVDLTDITIAEGYTYWLEINAQQSGGSFTNVRIYSVQIETDDRNL